MLGEAADTTPSEIWRVNTSTIYSPKKLTNSTFQAGPSDKFKQYAWYIKLNKILSQWAQINGPKNLKSFLSITLLICSYLFMLKIVNHPEQS